MPDQDSQPAARRSSDREHAAVLSHQIGALSRLVEEGLEKIDKRLDGIHARVKGLEDWRIETETEDRLMERFRREQGERASRSESFRFTKLNVVFAALAALAVLGSLVVSLLH